MGYPWLSPSAVISIYWDWQEKKKAPFPKFQRHANTYREISRAAVYRGQGNNYVQGNIFLLGMAGCGDAPKRRDFLLLEVREGILWMKKPRRILLDLV